MTTVLAWRNPRGSEENWHLPEPEKSLTLRNRIIVTEIFLIYAAMIATVETCVYLALLIITLPCYLCTDAFYDSCSKKLSSSLFTIGWALADACFFNIFERKLATHESFARYWGLGPWALGKTHLQAMQQLYWLNGDKFYEFRLPSWFPTYGDPGRLNHIIRTGELPPQPRAT